MSIVYCRADRKDCQGPVFEQAAKMGQWLNNRGFTVVLDKIKDKDEWEVHYGDERAVYKFIRIAFQSDDKQPSVIWPAGSPEDLLMKFLSGRRS